MAKGRKPKPTTLKVIEGNPGKRRIRTDTPKPPPKKPTMPSWLPEEGKREWRRVVPLLDDLGVISEIDRTMLAVYCNAVAVFREAAEDVSARGNLIQSARKDGARVKNPSLQVLRDEATIIRTSAEALGLSPAARARLTIPTDGGEDTLESVLGSLT